MKMAALQLMQQKANKDAKANVPAITETAETPTENKAETTQTPASESTSATEASTDSPSQTENNTSAASQAATEGEDKSSKPTANRPQNGECKSPLEGKELEEMIPGLAQAKELAQTLVAEDGSCIGTSENPPKIRPGQRRESYSGGSLHRKSDLY